MWGVLVHVCLHICTKESLSSYLNTHKAIHGGENGSVYYLFPGLFNYCGETLSKCFINRKESKLTMSFKGRQTLVKTSDMSELITGWKDFGGVMGTVTEQCSSFKHRFR